VIKLKGKKDSAKPGIYNLKKLSRRLTVGKRCSFTPNKTILTVATTKLGTAIPIVTMIIIILSTAVFFLSALIVPERCP